MKRAVTGVALGALALAAFELAYPGTPGAQTKNLQIEWIDTEGGAATLILSPEGESLLIDTGYPEADRDAKRIFAAAQKMGLRKIDSVLISHWHSDHEGGLTVEGHDVDVVDRERRQRLACRGHGIGPRPMRGQRGPKRARDRQRLRAL